MIILFIFSTFVTFTLALWGFALVEEALRVSSSLKDFALHVTIEGN